MESLENPPFQENQQTQELDEQETQNNEHPAKDEPELPTEGLPEESVSA